MIKNRHTVVRCFNDHIYEENGERIKYGLFNMMADMRNKLESENRCITTDKGDVKWIMSRDTFNWIISRCIDEPDFYWSADLSFSGPTRYKIMDIEVEFVGYEYMHRVRIVELLYTGPDVIGDIEVKEKKTMPFYVGYGEKVTIENVIFNNPATIVFWSDGTKTVVKKQKGDKKFDPEKGLAMAICKKIMGNKGNFNDNFKEWIKEE